MVVPKNDSSDCCLKYYKGITYNRHVCVDFFIFECAYYL